MKIFVFTTLFFSLVAMSANSAEPEQYSIHCPSLSEAKSGTYNPIFSDISYNYGIDQQEMISQLNRLDRAYINESRAGFFGCSYQGPDSSGSFLLSTGHSCAAESGTWERISEPIRIEFLGDFIEMDDTILEVCIAEDKSICVATCSAD
ncbi:MAG: hypothetical protein E2O89_05090 [Alphaproteobacteria bacterium]|nr:MAG: hypothetical protein E2O89_05090 [Alphaproteobacteria bacterium]